jgi:hypothetical protein
MARKLNTNFQNNGAAIKALKTKQKLTKAPTIGFEWEIPSFPHLFFIGFSSEEDYVQRHNDVELEYDYSLFRGASWRTSTSSPESPMSFDWLKKLGYFNPHIDGGAAIEVASPIFPTLGMAKANARFLRAEVDKCEWTDGVRGNSLPIIYSGIHVHVASSDKNETDAAYLKRHHKIGAMLNRVDATGFVKAISGRYEEGQVSNGYQANALSLGWDTSKGGSFIGNNYMVKQNNPSLEKLTTEFRLFSSQGHLLETALDFSHSVWRFCDQHKGDTHPYLHEWKTWLMKQKGYRNLKKNPTLNLIEGET